ncbi:MAG: outer membrane lipoprotein-sorting protein [Kiritimatiellia bacterium]
MICRCLLLGAVLPLVPLSGIAEPVPDAVPETTIEVAAGLRKTPPKLTVASDPAAVLRAARAMLPRGAVELKGALILRNRKGIVAREYAYRLVMRRTADLTTTQIDLSPRGETNVLASATVSRRGDGRPAISLVKAGAAEAGTVPSFLDRVMETDVTWLDLTLDFLWWPTARCEEDREGETVHGQKCLVIFAQPKERVEGLSGVRLWVDKKTGCMLQAEQVNADGKPIRRLWGTRIKKFGNRWMASVLEAETLGARHRTKITVEELNEL